MPIAKPTDIRSASFSPCRRYRYWLRIVWDDSKPLAAFIGLNPSTADEVKDDPTVRRCRNFASSWGCGGMVMFNLFPFRATLPTVMKVEADPDGDWTKDDLLASLKSMCTGPWVACWGTHGSHRFRVQRWRSG